MTLTTQLILGWLALSSAWAFVLFGYDKWLVGRTGRGRVSESTLLFWSAVGGWPGGMLGMLVFRHKSAKPSFQLKFIGSFLVWLMLGAGALRLSGLL